jgi:hypothetical protein
MCGVPVLFSYYSSSTVLPLRMTDRDTRGDVNPEGVPIGCAYAQQKIGGSPTSRCACAHPREPLRSPPVALSITDKATCVVVVVVLPEVIACACATGSGVTGPDQK